MNSLNSAVSSLRKRYASYKYDQNHKARATKVLKKIETTKGQIDVKLIRLSDEYAKDIFGSIIYAPWLYVYSALSASFKEGWIPDNYYGKIVVPAIQGDYGRASNLKALSNLIFKSNAFPDLAYYVNGSFFSNIYGALKEDDLKEFLFSESKVVVFKADNTIQGRGVCFFDIASFNLSDLKRMGNGVFQKYINQHQFFEELMPNSVATIRVTSVINNQGIASVRACYLRIGRKADTHVQSASHIRIPINIVTGELDDNGYLPSWTTIDKHPDTQTIFSGVKIPVFDKVIMTALRLHNSIRQVKCIGWDLIVDADNCINVMEWNGSHNDIKFSEATQGPSFSDLGWEKLGY